MRLLRHPRTIGPSFPYIATPAGTASAAAWHDLYSSPIATDNTGWFQFTLRQGIAVAAYDALAPATGTQMRATMKAASVDGVIFSQAWIGHVGVGDNIDFDGTQVQLLFSGIASGTIGAGGTLVSDARNYSFDKTKALVVTVHFSGTSSIKKTDPLANYTGAFAVDGADVLASQTDVTVGGGGSDFDSASRLYLFSKVEVFG